MQEVYYWVSLPWWSSWRQLFFFSCTTPSIFCEKFLDWFHHVNWMHAAIGVEVTLFLAGGTALVFHHVMTTKNAFTGQEIGALSGDTHWKSVVVYEPSRQEKPRTEEHPGLKGKADGKKARYIDTSTLTDKQNGIALGYASFHASSLYNNMTNIGNGTISLLTLPTTIGTIVFHILRAVIIPFYIGACMAIEYCREEPLFEARYHGAKPNFFEIKDIFLESGKSIFHVIKAPFFATAFLLANLYCLLDPLNGNKLAAAIEQEWNDGISLSEGFWSKEGREGNWKEFTRAAGPDRCQK